MSVVPSLSAVFSNVHIPDGKYGVDSGTEMQFDTAHYEEIRQLADEMIGDIEAGKPVRLYFDNDGTLFRFNPDPAKTRMDEQCFAGLVRLSQYPNFLATSLTGRDVREAAGHMLTPGYDVRDSNGRTLNVAGDKTLRFAITGSHGVENMTKDGIITRYDFAEDFGPGVNDFIAGFKAECAALKAIYLGLTVEDGKHGAVGVNVRTIRTNDPDVKAAAYAHALETLERFASSGENPAHKTSGDKVFQIKREGSEELELRPVGFGKDFGILVFGSPDKSVRTLFLGDSFKRPDGTDLDAAALINNKAYFDKGSVIQVRNGRFEPELDGPTAPRVVFANPTMLGNFLCYVATQIEERRPLPSAPAKSVHRRHEPT